MTCGRTSSVYRNADLRQNASFPQIWPTYLLCLDPPGRTQKRGGLFTFTFDVLGHCKRAPRASTTPKYISKNIKLRAQLSALAASCAKRHPFLPYKLLQLSCWLSHQSSSLSSLPSLIAALRPPPPCVRQQFPALLLSSVLGSRRRLQIRSSGPASPKRGWGSAKLVGLSPRQYRGRSTGVETV